MLNKLSNSSLNSSLYLNNTKKSNISFGAKPPNYFVADKIMRDIKNKCYFSETLFDCKFSSFPLALKIKIGQQRFFNIYRKIREKTSECRYLTNCSISPSNSYQDIIKNSKNAINKTRGANCFENALLAQAELLSKGIKADLIMIRGYSKQDKDYANTKHVFTVINLADNAILSKPKTWGKNALVVDPWLGIIMNAKDAMNHYKAFYTNKRNGVIVHDFDVYENNLIDVSKERMEPSKFLYFDRTA